MPILSPARMNGTAEGSDTLKKICAGEAPKERSISTRRSLTVRNPESTSLDFSYVADVAQGLVRVLLSDVENETFNITEGQGRTLAELHELLVARFPDMPVEVASDTDDFRPKRGALDIAKARSLVGYEPKYPLERGVEQYLDFLASMSKDAPLVGTPA